MLPMPTMSMPRPLSQGHQAKATKPKQDIMQGQVWASKAKDNSAAKRSHTIFRYFGLVIYAKARMSKAKVKAISTRPRLDIFKTKAKGDGQYTLELTVVESCCPAQITNEVQ